MRQALYRNYRPRSFKELLGQDHITITLDRAVKSGRISHAYLFTGPKGVGKTSAARILAHSVNGLPYENENQHLDIIEIDAASNRRIDEIRDLREKVRTAPTTGKYKVYIIDEVHMLTREAFNALLKTLEEPPAHVIFILATTEAHKLPETIVSRTQRFEFKPIAAKQMSKHLQKIAESEKVSITPGALELLAEFGGGSFRDSISLLDQMSGAGKITEDNVRSSLGIPSAKSIDELLSAVDGGDAAEVLNHLQNLKDLGIDPASAAKAIAKKIREDAIASVNRKYAVGLLKELIDVPASRQPYDYLEICLLESAALNAKEESHAPKAAAQQQTKRPPTSVKKIERSKPKPAENFDLSMWPDVVDNARKRAASIYTALKLAKPAYEEGNILLSFEFPLHQKKLAEAKNKDIISGLIEELYGITVTIECVVDKEAFKSTQEEIEEPEITQPNGSLGAINNIFGSAEVVEA